MKILCVDTSSNNCSLAVVTEDALLGEVNINYNLQHSTLLMPLIEELLQRLDMEAKDINALAVSTGPGSFTGLRIGLAAMKGIATGLQVPLYAADSLKVLAYGAFGFQGLIVPMVDALRGGFYTGIYRFNKEHLETLHEPVILTFDELKERLKDETQPILILGDAQTKLSPEALCFQENVLPAPPVLNIPKAANLAYLLKERIARGESEDIHTLVPLYLRKSQAEHEYEKKKGLRS